MASHNDDDRRRPPEEFQKLAKMTEKKWNVYRRPITLVLNVGLFVVGLTMTIVLLWHRFTWGFKEWIHEIFFFNFWNGTYVIITDAILLCITCVLGFFAVKKRSVCWLLMVSVFHGLSILLLLVGSIAMLADAFSTREIWLAKMIIDAIDPLNQNNNALKDQFLGNMYRIVNCCGASGPSDYTDRFSISPLPECLDTRHAGGIYYEEGCAHKFLVWLKAWSGVIGVLSLIIISLELLLMSWSIQLLRLLKREQRKVFDTKEYKKQERQKLLLHNEGGSGNGGENGQELSNAIQTSGIIKETKSVENFQSAFPPPPIRSTSRSEWNLNNGQIGGGGTPAAAGMMFAIPIAPIVVTNTSAAALMTNHGLMPTDLMENTGSKMSQANNVQHSNHFQHHQQQQQHPHHTPNVQHQQQTLFDPDQNHHPQLNGKSRGMGLNGQTSSQSRSSSQKTENSTIAFTETMAAKSIMEVDNPSENSRRNNSSRSNRSFHNNSKETAEKCKQRDEETPIKYTEPHNFRGKQSFGDRNPKVSSNSKQTSIASRSTKSHNYSLKDTNSVRFNQLNNDSDDGSDEEQIRIQNNNQLRRQQKQQGANDMSGNAENTKNTRKNTNKQLSQPRSSYPNSNFSNSNTTNTRSESNNTQALCNTRTSTTTNSQESSWRITDSPNLPPMSDEIENIVQGLQKYHHYESIESASGTTTSVSENVAKSVGDSDIKKFYREIRPGCTPVVKQPGEGVASKNIKNVSNQNNESYEEPIRSQKLDRTREWVASHESLGLPALPPKPTSGMPTSGGIQSIPYGYENVLPISQRYKQNPYSMLSSAGTDTETMTCTSDDESEYSTANKMQQVINKRQMMKLAIARNTVIEENPSEEIATAEDEKRYRKRLAVSETSI